jgi:MOSC domain-containing protein YiiM
MDMIVLNVNLGTPKRWAGMRSESGIGKVPVEHRVAVHTLGLGGDSVCNTRHHGGPDQAVYIYGQSDYAWWEALLGKSLPLGTFGENLTISGLESATFNVGDRLLISDVVLEVTAPRIPCGTLAKRMGDKTFPQQFDAALRPGLYCRVIREGGIQRGDAVQIERFTGPRVNIVDMYNGFYRSDETEAELEHLLSAPIASRARHHKSKQLQSLRRV